MFRLRYAVYVEELKYPQAHADHAARTVREPLNDTGHVLAAFDDAGRVIGSVRNNYGCECDFGGYARLYGMERFLPYFPQRVGVSTKLVVAPECRCGTLMPRLCLAAFAYSVTHFPNHLFGLIDSKPPLDHYFRRLGYRQVAPPIVHPAAGVVTPLVMCMHDADHLRRCGSPFAKLVPEVRDEQSVRWFRETFADELARSHSPTSTASTADE